MTKQEIAIAALQRAENNASEANYDVIFDGFIDMGIAKEDIEPRVNVFTFNAWKAKGRFVKKGEKGVKVITYILVDKKEKDSDETKKVKVKRQTTVFHISQTSPLDEPTEPEDKKLLTESESTEKKRKRRTGTTKGKRADRKTVKLVRRKAGSP
ncbi:TPA: ArdC-like ssDNA-binding domain-containing protein [Proteus mirabilis]